MAAPNLVTAIGIKAGAANIGEYVIVRNFTRGGKLTGKVAGADRSIVFNPAPSTQWQEGDVIQAEIRGRLQGVKKVTIQGGSANIKLTGVADTTTPGVSL